MSRVSWAFAGGRYDLSDSFEIGVVGIYVTISYAETDCDWANGSSKAYLFNMLFSRVSFSAFCNATFL
jgi:hypothetical protein